MDYIIPPRFPRYPHRSRKGVGQYINRYLTVSKVRRYLVTQRIYHTAVKLLATHIRTYVSYTASVHSGVLIPKTIIIVLPARSGLIISYCIQYAKKNCQDLHVKFILAEDEDTTTANLPFVRSRGKGRGNKCRSEMPMVPASPAFQVLYWGRCNTM